ncbi:MAG: tRNA 2-selenouridine(34) synthase MnmH, partial [Burkholderiales bacterium]
QYALVIDARSQREYVEDHLPCAVSLPVVDNEEYAEVGTTHRTDTHRAYVIGVSYALRNISRSIDDLVARYPKDARMLVYCFRGGKRSKLWFDALSTIGYRVDRLPGGWKAYRAWVRDQLTELPRKFQYHVLCGPTGCGKTRLLSALASVGAQVLDLEELAQHRGSLIGDIPGVAQPTQKWFDSLLVEKLRRFDPAHSVWVESESKKIGAIQLPSSLLETMHAARLFSVNAPMPERVALWREDYSHFERDLDAMMDRLRHLRPLVGGEEFAHWETLAKEKRATDLFQRLMEAHYDPAYSRSIRKNYPSIEKAAKVELYHLDRDALLEAARRLHREPATV